MKALLKPPFYFPENRSISLAALLLQCLSAVLLGVLLVGCAAEPLPLQESAVPAAGPSALSQTIPATVGALTAVNDEPEVIDLPTDTPTNIPTLTPPPTASVTTTPSLTPTASSTAETVAAATIIPIETMTPTKPAPLPTPSGTYSWTLKVPILMYHYISYPPQDADKYRRDLSVTPASFEKQMAYLAENGFETVDLYDLSLAITGKRDLPPKPVVITLDDGYVDNFENAFPILREHGLEATFFVVTGFIDEGREEYMTWEMVEEMAAAGMRIEPHSKTHPDLSGQERDYVIYEVLGAQETIAAHVGYTPRYFCYPGGRYDEQTLEVLQELDYWGAVTTAGGDWHGFEDRFEWSRMRMRNTTTLSEFAGMVDPGGLISGKPAPE